MPDENKSLHWLVRPATIRRLWYGFIGVLAVIVLAQAVVPVKGYFALDGWFGFGAVYGFVSCLLMVLVAKVLGLVLKRPSGYFGDQRDPRDPDVPRNRAKEHSDGS